MKPYECVDCSLYQKGQGFIQPDGLGTNGIIIVNSHPDHKAYMEGKPMRPTSESGVVIDSAFRILSASMGRPVSRDQFKIWSTIGCYPPNNQLGETPYEHTAVEHCKVHFEKEVGEFKTPHNKTVLALGNIPLVRLTGVTGEAKYKQSISHLRGYVFNSGYGWVIPTYDAGYIKRGGGHLMPVFLDDIKKAIRVANGTYTGFKDGKGFREPNYIVHPSIDDAWQFYYRVKDSPRLVLTYDIETPLAGDMEEEEKEAKGGAVEILQVQFSLGKNEGIAFPWEGEYIKIAKALFALDNVKANHNTWNFDNPILRDHGIKFGIGKIHDTMWMFKHWHPMLERGLQKVVSLFDFPFPWKHLYGSELAYYGCADVDAVQYILKALPPLMKEKGVWEGYTRYVYDLHIEMDKMVARGFPVDETKRLELEVDLTQKMDKVYAEMQALYPKEIKNITPKRKNKETGEYSYGYVRPPKDAVALLAEGMEKGFSGKDLAIYVRDNSSYIRKDINDEEEYVPGLVVKKFIDPDGEQVFRWCRIQDFSPSSQQVIAYLEYRQSVAKTQKEKNQYKVPLTLKPDPKTGVRRKTTGKDELIPIWEATDDKLIEYILKYRSLKKMLTNDIPNWKPNPKTGRVHAEIGYTAATGQMNAKKPNLFNASKHAPPEVELLWGDDVPPTKRFRDMIVAPKGYCFLEFDKKSFHVGMMGFQAEDEEYFRFSQLDPHTIFTSWIVDGVEPILMKWSNADIMLACDEVKKKFKQIRQQQAKPTILGNQLGLGPYKLQRQNRKFIKTIRRAEELQKRLKHGFPKVENFKDKVLEDAHFAGWDGIINAFQRIQYFYDVYQWHYNDRVNRWDKKHGNDQEKVLAFHVQSPCFGMIQDEILEFGRLGLDEEFNFVNTIHDSTIFLPEIGKREKCIEQVYKVMTTPNQRLKNKIAPGGLVINVEVSMGNEGESLKQMKEIEYPVKIKD